MNASALTRQLVRIPSVSGTDGQSAVIEHVVRRLSKTGLEIRSARHRGALTSVAVVPARRDRPLLLFACHVDTVPVVDPAAWAHDPFGGMVHDGRVWGRGSSDMKAGLAAAVVALEKASARNVSVGLVLTSDEEVGCAGALEAAELLGTDGVGAIVVPESTDNRVALGHRGALWIGVRVRGVEAHGSTPERGVNAIVKLNSLLARAIDELPLLPASLLGSETVNIGAIAGGSVPNMVPAEATASIDLRLTGPDSRERILEWWNAQPEIDSLSIDIDLPPIWSDPADPWLDILPAEVRPEPVAYFTDAALLAPALGVGRVAIWGPGDPAVVHSVDEFVTTTAIESAAANFLAACINWERTG